MTDWGSFIWEHREDNPGKLALSAKKHPDWPMGFIARQVEALQKVCRKIPAWYREGVVFPIALSLEQASSEATARFKASLFSGKKMADLTGGLGVDAYFFSEKFNQVFFVEKIPAILDAARHNFNLFGQSNVVFVQEQAETFLVNSPQYFELIYLDPARRDEVKGKVFQLADCSPDVVALKDLLLSWADQVLVKTAPMLDIHQALKQLKNVAAVWVVEYDGDCREVLYLLEKKALCLEHIPIHVVSLYHSGQVEHAFDFTFQEEQQTTIEYASTGNFLYEPMPSLLKAGAFKTFASRFGLKKIHPNTHLYTSDQYIPHLPARSFRVQAVCKYDKKIVSTFVPEGSANISTRNFPDNPALVRKKLGLLEGGNTFIFAATDGANNKLLFICSKVSQGRPSVL
jgi:16S rRNA G966 N2-methylase RsmD